MQSIPFHYALITTIALGFSLKTSANDQPDGAPDTSTDSMQIPYFELTLQDRPTTAQRSESPSPVKEQQSPPALSLSEPAQGHAAKEQASDQPLYGCACGCGVFEVGTSSMFPRHEGGMVWIEWDYQDQTRNRHGTRRAPSADNDDKELRTEFYNVGVQYLFNRNWGIQVEVPVDHRHWVSGESGAFDWTSLGDIRLKGLYTGLSEDLSIGIDFGVKIPTGNFRQQGPDRDTQIGTGSTDLLLGAFYRTPIDKSGVWNLFAQVEGDLPVAWQQGYRPGFEVDAAAGVYYGGFRFHGVTISPLGQVIVSHRASDGGPQASYPVGSGYDRVLLSPGVEFDVHPFSIYADVEIPVYQYFKGDQLSAPAMFKIIMSYAF